MEPQVLSKDLLVVGNRVEILAICQRLEIRQNAGAVGSFREIFYLGGKDGAYVESILFKNAGATKSDKDDFKQAPVMITGIVNEYQEKIQIVIESIRNLSNIMSLEDLSLNMHDSTITSELNNLLYSYEIAYAFKPKHLNPPLGLENASVGSLVTRMFNFLKVAEELHEKLNVEYLNNIQLIVPHYLDTEDTLLDRINLAKITSSELVKHILFPQLHNEEYEEFVKLHTLIMKPRGNRLEILDNSNTSTNSDIRNS